MILTDFLLSEKSIQWDMAKQCGVNHAVIRLPESSDFDITDRSHWEQIHKSFTDFGLKPVIIEPMPNFLHDHIKTGDIKRDESIEKVIKMFPIMESLDINTICFNFMAEIGWLRTVRNIKERGGAEVTGFDIDDYIPDGERSITKDQLWDNYEYFINAVMPYADKHNIKMALHPDDPPIPNIGKVSRIMIDAKSIERAVNTYKSNNLGITMCQANFHLMGEDLYKIIPQFADKIFFVHFRNVTGTKYKFNETFHDNGDIDMVKMMKLYKKHNIDVPVRVDHVPIMAYENNDFEAGYSSMGRLFAIGYLKGILQSIEEFC